MTYIELLNAFNRFIEDDSLTDKAVILYYGLLDTFNRRRWPRWAGVDTQRLMMLARSTNKPTALRARDALVKAGLIEYRPGKKGKATEYRLLEYWRTSDTESDTKNVTECVTENVTENVTPNKTKKKTKNIPLTPLPEELGYGPELTETVRQWVGYRKELRKPLTATGYQSLLKNIGKHVGEYGEAAIVDLLNLSMSSGWQGVFFNRLEKQPAAAEPTPARRGRLVIGEDGKEYADFGD